MTHEQVTVVDLYPRNSYARCACGFEQDAGSTYLAAYLLHSHIVRATMRDSAEEVARDQALERRAY